MTIEHNRATFTVGTVLKNAPPQLICTTNACPDCGGAGNLHGQSRADALTLPMARCPNKGHASWRLAWHIPEPAA